MSVDRRVKERLRLAVETSRNGEQLGGQVLRAVRLGRRAYDLSQGVVVMRWRGAEIAMMQQLQI